MINEKSFAKYPTVMPLPNLVEIQLDSYREFMRTGLRDIFDEVSPIKDWSGKELELAFTDYYFDEPKYTEERAKFLNLSYEAPLRVKVKLTNHKTGQSKEQESYFGDFPLMTDRGTFIVNGVERVVVSQLIRSPGAFFTSNYTKGKKVFGAKLIPNRGAWLEFETDADGVIYTKIDRKRKIPVTSLLRVFGLETDEAILKAFSSVIPVKTGIQNLDSRLRGNDKKESENDNSGHGNEKGNPIQATLDKDPVKTRADALIEIYKRLRPGDLATVDSAGQLVEAAFFNFKRYDLGKVGRWKLNQRLGLDSVIPVKTGIQNLDSRLRGNDKESRGNDKEGHENDKKENSEKGKNITEKDRLLNVNDIVGVTSEIIKLNQNPHLPVDDIDHLANRRVRALGELLQNKLKIGLARMERIVRDRMSTLDPHTLQPVQMINARPFTAAVKEFFTSSQLSQFMDQNNPLAELEHKRRISSMGPGGLTRERAGFEVRDVHPTYYGRICPIQTPEGPNVGLVGHIATNARLNEFGFLITPYRKVKNSKVTDEIVYLDAFEEQKVDIAPVSAPMDESGRLLEEQVEARVKGQASTTKREKIDYMDVSPQQCISVATALIPFLEHDDANRALMGSNMQRQAVACIKPQAPIVGTGMEEKAARDSGQLIVSEVEGEVAEVDADHIKIKFVIPVKTGIQNLDSRLRGNDKEGTINYPLRTFVRTNQFTCINQHPIVKKGDKVKKGDVLADGAATEEGRLALGQNLLVAFLSWRGSNFEDAIILSDRVVDADSFTSIHIEDFPCDVRETKLGPEITTPDIPNVGEERLKDLDEEGVVRIGASVGPNDILVGKISPKGESDLTAEERLLKAIFGEKARDVKDTSLRLSHGKRGRVVGVKVFSREKGDKLPSGVIKQIQVEIAELRKVMVGDKLAGRHGNKGVISKIMPAEEMPYLEDGTPVDIILNPLGIASRMNIGQLLETHLGWAGKILGYHAQTPALGGATENDIKDELKKAGLPEHGKVKLFDGRTGEPFNEEISVGYIYIMKLHHLVEDKIHMRSIGPYSLITQQPLGGKAQFGGQRFGEMEVWALEGYGAAHTLQEMLTIKSDDVMGRTATYDAIIRGQEIKAPNIPASFDVLVSELKALGMDVELKKDAESL